MRYKKKDKQLDTNKEVETIEKDSSECNYSTSVFEASVDTSFFYTSDKILNSFDDIEIIQKIQEKYPEFNLTNKDTQLKKIFLILLDDKVFVDSILNYYLLTIFDFFKLIYKQYSSLFNTLFIKKVKDKIRINNYAEITEI